MLFHPWCADLCFAGPDSRSNPGPSLLPPCPPSHAQPSVEEAAWVADDWDEGVAGRAGWPDEQGYGSLCQQPCRMESLIRKQIFTSCCIKKIRHQSD